MSAVETPVDVRPGSAENDRMIRRRSSTLSLRAPAAVLLVAFVTGAAGCQCGGAATTSSTSSSAAPSASSAPVASAAPPASSASAPAPMVSAPPRQIAGAAQVLIAFKGAELAPKGVTRAKADAKKLADDVLKKIKKDNLAFEEAAKKFSDDEASKNAGGAIGNFEKNAMPEAFSTATFELKLGEISDVVETPRGFHIIKRTR